MYTVRVDYLPLQMTRLEKLQKTNLNIFTTDDLVILWEVENRREAIESVKDYTRRGRMFSIKKGVYSLTKEYDIKELSQKLITPSYISYYTALGIHGIIFQKYSEIHCMASYSKTFDIKEQKFIYHKTTQEILHSQKGILIEANYTIANPERAVCDSLYLNSNSAFDNLRNVSIEKLQEVAKIYKNKRLEKDIEKLIQYIKKDVK